MSRNYSNNSSNKIFVGNIQYGYNENELKELLQTVGPISGKIEKKSKGFAFVEYKDKESKISALKNLKKIEYNGRQLEINLENNSEDIIIDEESLRLSRDISYLKSNFENFSDLSENQKGVLFLITKFLSDKYPQEFENILSNQNEEFLVEFLSFQEEYMRRFPNS